MKSKEALQQLYMCATGQCDRCAESTDGHCRERADKAMEALSKLVNKKKRRLRP